MNTCGLFFLLGMGISTNPTPEFNDRQNPLAIMRTGVECDGGMSVDWEHRSSINDGPPINERRDYRNTESLFVSYKWTWR